ncbi:hypothetical protein BvCmsKSP038_02072 [Escherichia coli]|nr:hypothetical protein BvCmsKSP038_02072 [Escherichia coli]GDK71395.1 hypothetical protein BvCmsKSP055_04693 [Escherichia coli]GDN01966.1 hypothetical protein BvCmsKSP063_05030 [Escherichia coli]GDQ64392.1 hypothetical protein BvCmsNSP009_03868 [Escherichia coli]GDV15298.1 hypothetical protein BvCmsSIP010_01146 [Escherichia coli]
MQLFLFISVKNYIGKFPPYNTLRAASRLA